MAIRMDPQGVEALIDLVSDRPEVARVIAEVMRLLVENSVDKTPLQSDARQKPLTRTPQVSIT